MAKNQEWTDAFPYPFDQLPTKVLKSTGYPTSFHDALELVLKTLPLRERDIIKLRYGFGDGYIYTYEEVAEIFRISVKKAKELEGIAVRKLQHPTRAKYLEGFLAFRFEPPTKDIASAIRESQEAIIARIQANPKEMYLIDPRHFEKIICEIFESFGYTVELTQQTRDGGMDLICLKKDELGITTKYIVEVKRYGPKKPVRVELVRMLYGVKLQQQADHAILATTSYFTKTAEKFASGPTVINLHLRDVNKVLAWIDKYAELKQQGGVLLGQKCTSRAKERR